MNLDESSRIKASFFLVDRKFVLFIGLKDDTKRTSDEAIGVSIFSSIRSTVLSYVTIFEIIWRQQEPIPAVIQIPSADGTHELIIKQLKKICLQLLKK